jgi:hypothetical protein
VRSAFIRAATGIAARGLADRFNQPSFGYDSPSIVPFAVCSVNWADLQPNSTNDALQSTTTQLGTLAAPLRQGVWSGGPISLAAPTGTAYLAGTILQIGSGPGFLVASSVDANAGVTAFPVTEFLPDVTYGIGTSVSVLKGTAAIDAFLAWATRSPGRGVVLRLQGGKFAPAWFKAFADAGVGTLNDGASGSPFTMTNGVNSSGVGGTCGSYWTASARTAIKNLHTLLAARYDAKPGLAMVDAGLGGYTLFSEPDLAFHLVDSTTPGPSNIYLPNAVSAAIAGVGQATDGIAIGTALQNFMDDASAAWPTTPLYHAFNPYHNLAKSSQPKQITTQVASAGNSGATVTYPSATALVDTAAAFTAGQVGLVVTSGANTATIQSVTNGTTLVVSAWSPATPAAGAAYTIPGAINIATAPWGAHDYQTGTPATKFAACQVHRYSGKWTTNPSGLQTLTDANAGFVAAGVVSGDKVWSDGNTYAIDQAPTATTVHVSAVHDGNGDDTGMEFYVFPATSPATFGYAITDNATNQLIFAAGVLPATGTLNGLWVVPIALTYQTGPAGDENTSSVSTKQQLIHYHTLPRTVTGNNSPRQSTNFATGQPFSDIGAFSGPPFGFQTAGDTNIAGTYAGTDNPLADTITNAQASPVAPFYMELPTGYKTSTAGFSGKSAGNTANLINDDGSAGIPWPAHTSASAFALGAGSYGVVVMKGSGNSYFVSDASNAGVMTIFPVGSVAAADQGTPSNPGYTLYKFDYLSPAQCKAFSAAMAAGPAHRRAAQFLAVSQRSLG